MPSLYELTKNYHDALDAICIDEETGEVTGFDVIDSIGADIEDKAEAVALYIKNLEAFSEAIYKEMTNLKLRYQTNTKKVDSLKRHLQKCLDIAGKERIETPKAKISFRMSKAVVIDNEEVLPKEYIICKTEYSPNKTAIKQAFKEGKTVLGARLVENRNIQIK